MRLRPEAESAFALLLVDSRMPEWTDSSWWGNQARSPTRRPPYHDAQFGDLLAADGAPGRLSCYVVKPVMAASLLRAILQSSQGGFRPHANSWNLRERPCAASLAC